MDLFISHASDDKDEIARPLAHMLRDRGFSVWYDEFALALGDNLRRSIDEGLSSCRFGLVVLSPRFLEKSWTQSELDALIAREVGSEQKVVLPILHRLTQSDLLRYSPSLAGRISISTADGLERVVEAIAAAMKKSGVIPTADTPDSLLARYDVLRTIHEGHYGHVFKCRNRATGEICVVKSTIRGRVSSEALERLRTGTIPNLAKPRATWENHEQLFEELPYVGGVRLSETIIPGVGGLSGSVLETCHEQLMDTLAHMHAAGVIHRDVHPENVYLVIERDSGQIPALLGSARQEWNFNEFGTALVPFRLAWVLVDCSFACLTSSSKSVSFRHGVYTSREQEAGSPVPASDMYALGATLFYCITGREMPSFRRRQNDPSAPSNYPSGGHSSVRFSSHLEALLSLDPQQRPSARTRLGSDTVASGYTGTLRLSDDLLLLCNHFESETLLLSRRQAIPYFEEVIGQWPYTKPSYTQTPGDAHWWLASLKGHGSGRPPKAPQ